MAKRKPKTYVALVLDKSGSMSSCSHEAITTFNEQLDVLAEKTKDQNIVVTQVNFNHEIGVITENVKTKDVVRLDEKNYNPDGMTAMYDAMGRAIEILEANKDLDKKDVACLVIVVSDGYENSSQKYNASSIGERIKSLQDTGKWTFTYLGANQDLSQVSQQLHIPKGNLMAFANTNEGMADLRSVNLCASHAYFSGRAVGLTNSENYYIPTTGTSQDVPSDNGSAEGE